MCEFSHTSLRDEYSDPVDEVHIKNAHYLPFRYEPFKADMLSGIQYRFKDELSELTKEERCMLADDIVPTPLSSSSLSNWIYGDKSNTFTEPKIKSLMRIAKALGVTVDYLVGLSEIEEPNIKYKVGSREFGLSSKAMKRLERVKRRSKDELAHKGNVSSALINFILENDDFWHDIDDLLPVYLMNRYEHRTIQREIDISKFYLTETFGRLLEDICEKYYK